MAVINVLVSLMCCGRRSKENGERERRAGRSEEGGREGEPCQHITNIRNGLVFT